MSKLKSKSIIAGMGVAVLAASIGVAVSGTANAATPSCGNGCTDVFSHQFGNFADPQFVMDSYKQEDVTGAPVILFRTSNSDPAEDFTVDNQGLTSEFFAAGLVSAAVALHYGCTPAVFTACAGPVSSTNPPGGVGFDFEAYEFMYSPFGVQTGLCVGVGVTAAAGMKVTLQPCGVSGKTIWIAADVEHVNCPAVAPLVPVKPVCTVVPTGLQMFAQPLVNGSDTNFSQPFALTYPNSSYPTDTPRPQLYTTGLLGFSQSWTPGDPDAGSLNSNQLWSADTGILP
jgi:hypothetical protein